MSMKINKLEIENVKRVKAVTLEPASNGLTIVGGKNNQGKTSVLDAIAWALGGNKFKPSEPQRDGSVIPPSLKVVMSNGLVVERKGKNSDLKVIDPSGGRGGQQLLDSFVEQLALDLPKFMQATNKEKAQTLLQIVGVGEQLFELEQEEAELYNKRHAIGQISDQKAKFAAEQSFFPEAPKEPVSASDLISQQQEILARNGENQRKRSQLTELQHQFRAEADEVAHLNEQITALTKRRDEILSVHVETSKSIDIASKTVKELQDESTEALEKSLQEIETINAKVRKNQDKERADYEAKEYKNQYDELTAAINAVRQAKADLLQSAKLPLDGLSVDDGELSYKGFKWDNMSGSDQLKVATAIVRKLKPDCGFVLIDKLEQMDLDTLKEFGEWIESEGLQAIATRVSTGEECSIIICDGYAEEPVSKANPKFQKGQF